MNPGPRRPTNIGEYKWLDTCWINSRNFIVGQGNADLKDILIEENFITTKVEPKFRYKSPTCLIATLGTQFSVNSKKLILRGITFNNTGTKMFIVGTTGDDVNEYTVSTGFDPPTSTVTFVDSFAASIVPIHSSSKFNTNGTKMFVTGVGNSNVPEYPSQALHVSHSKFYTNISDKW